MKANSSLLSPQGSLQSRETPFPKGIEWEMEIFRTGQEEGNWVIQVWGPCKIHCRIDCWFVFYSRNPEGRVQGRKGRGWGLGQTAQGGSYAPGSLQRGVTALLSGQSRLPDCNLSGDRAGTEPHNQRVPALQSQFPSESVYCRAPLGPTSGIRWRKRGNGDRFLETLVFNHLFWKLLATLNMFLTS